MKVRCKFCDNLDGSFCSAKKSGGKHPKVKPNKSRVCSKYKVDPYALAEEADREYKKGQIPVYSPTWRMYADKETLDRLNAHDGPKYVRINPDVG